MNIEIRKDFPILDNGVIYLDNAATSLTPEPVLEAILEYYREYNANVNRGIHRLSQVASGKYEEAHRKIANLIKAKEREIVFTKNTTESINLIASGLKWKEEDKIVTTSIEHHSNFIPWLRIKSKFNTSIDIVKPNREGIFELDDFERTIDKKTKLVAVTHVSNVLGSITPIREISKICKENHALLLVDGAQSVPHIPISVKELGCDFLCFSGHKMLGPTGTGILFMKEELLGEVEPLTIGGGSIENVLSDGYELTESWEKFEAGTPNIADSIGLGRAVEYLEKIGMENIRKHEEKLTRKLLDGLAEIENLEVYGPQDSRKKVGVVSFNIAGLNSHDVAWMLDEGANIMVRSGHHCCMPLMKTLGVEGTVRASLYLYNTTDEIVKLLDSIEEITKVANKKPQEKNTSKRSFLDEGKFFNAGLQKEYRIEV